MAKNKSNNNGNGKIGDNKVTNQIKKNFDKVIS